MLATAMLAQERVVTETAAARSERIPLGGPIEREQFLVSRKLPNLPSGLTLLILDADVLANSKNDLADLRLATADNRQVPYLVEQRKEPLTIRLKVPSAQTRGRSSVYRFILPYERLPAGTRLVLTTGAGVFDRHVTLRHLADNHRNRRSATISTATWRNSDSAVPAPPLTFDLLARSPRGVEVIVDEGDNAALPIASAQLLLPSYALRFDHPGTPLFLLYGNRRAHTPRYDLTLLAPRLRGEKAREVTMPAGSGHVPPLDENGPARKLFWVGIAVAAVVLIVLLVRLLSGETSRAPNDSM